MSDLQKAIIVDIDGTLAKMSGRSPFEWHRVGEDRVNTPIRHIVNLLAKDGYFVFIFSGRDGVCVQETRDWLVNNGIEFDVLLMRDPKNQERDSIIKRRLYDEHVAGKFDIHFVLDDRNQVVDMWRKDLGLVCLQVDYGDF